MYEGVCISPSKCIPRASTAVNDDEAAFQSQQECFWFVFVGVVFFQALEGETADLGSNSSSSDSDSEIQPPKKKAVAPARRGARAAAGGAPKSATLRGRGAGGAARRGGKAKA